MRPREGPETPAANTSSLAESCATIFKGTVRQWPLQCLASSRGARIQTSRSKDLLGSYNRNVEETSSGVSTNGRLISAVVEPASA
jgi:hypothetical protein